MEKTPEVKYVVDTDLEGMSNAELIEFIDNLYCYFNKTFLEMQDKINAEMERRVDGKISD